MAPIAPTSAQRDWTLSDFDFQLPPELIAQHPSADRSASQLLDGRGQPARDRSFRELPGLLEPGDLLVFNDTQVIKARLFGQKATGGRLELLVERVLDASRGTVAAHMKVSKKPAPGSVLQMDGGFAATVIGRWPDANGPLYQLAFAGEPYALMAAHGHVPLPPYITHDRYGRRRAALPNRVCARPGAVAAPTAALHFDEACYDALEQRGGRKAPACTLHVGAGTFQPVKTENIAEHLMHSEWFEVPASHTCRPSHDCKARGGRVVAVGTTTVRTLESLPRNLGPACDDTNIFITPGFEFQGGRPAADQLPPAQKHA
jgi:S-adenosylmethionine:tRNA ribosyltransferase-isomerase